MVTWWPGVEATTKETTRYGYLGIYKTWIGPALGAKPIAEIKRHDVQALVQKMIDAGKSSGTIKNTRRLLSQIMNDAMDEEVISRNPVRRVGTPKAPEPRRRSLTPAQVNAVLDGTHGPLRCACYLAMVGGLREGEVSALTWDQIDRRAKTLLIDRQHVAVKSGNGKHKKGKRRPADLRVTLPKRGKVRVIALPQSMIDAIDAMGNLDSTWVVSDKDGPLSPRSIGGRWEVARKDLGLAHFTFHDLRHVAAGLLHGHEAGDLTIMGTLGHSKIDMTRVYTEVAQDTQRAALERVVDSVDNYRLGK